MTIERALELLPQMRDSEWITALGKKTALYTDEAKEAFNMAISALEKQEQDRWIPVTDRLPEEYGEYRITWKTSSDPGKRFIGDAEYEPGYEWDNDHDRFKGEWLLEDYIKIYPNVEVIAWKPLEEPYTEEES